MNKSADQKRVLEIIARLEKKYPEARCALHYQNPLQLLIATILSAQCTDEQVNKVTPLLFEKFKSVNDFANADLETLQNIIRSTGFYRNKARHIIATCQMLRDKFSGQVPNTMVDLLKLPGVARKTANVVLGNIFQLNLGIVVDTHVKRISKRLNLSRHDDPNKIEQDLMKLVPNEEWTMFSHYFIFHGRQTCNARKPRCTECSIQDLCPSANG